MVKRILNLYKRVFWSDEKYARNIGVKIGEGCRIATRYFGSEPYLIEIGDNVQLTTDVRFFTHGGGWVFRKKYPKMDTFGKIKLGNNIYVGNCVLIMPGITIGDNVIVGAGAVVTKSIEEGSIVAGNPAKVIGRVEELEEKIQPYNVNSKAMNYDEKKRFLLELPDDRFIRK